MVQIGKVYLDIWGNKVFIAGVTKFNPDKVYSRAGDWYNRKTGKRDGWAHNLILSETAEEEIAKIRGHLKAIRKANSESKLAIPTIAQGIRNMENRVRQLQRKIKKELAAK